VVTQHSLDGFNLPATPCLPKQPKSKQGQQAVTSGRKAEAFIYCILKEAGYTVQRQYLIGLGIYGEALKTDFYVTGLRDFPLGLIIESKWQEKPGSVDEKFPYLVQNIIRCYPCPAIIVYGGKGAREGGLEWLHTQADGQKLLAVFSLEEFLTWTIRNL
jgi:hypothetical protein